MALSVGRLHEGYRQMKASAGIRQDELLAPACVVAAVAVLTVLASWAVLSSVPRRSDAALAVASRFPGDAESMLLANVGAPSADQVEARFSSADAPWELPPQIAPPAPASQTSVASLDSGSGDATETSGTATVIPTERKPNPLAMLNDAMIADIKGRLKLTADQSRYWSPVEEALRGVSYNKPARRGATPTGLDSKTVEAVFATARTFIPRLDRTQRSEVRWRLRLLGATEELLTSMQL